MRVAMYYNNRDVRLEELPLPRIGPGELLVKVHASGICGSDVMEWYRLHKAPLVLGHEATGEIVEVGEGVDRYHVGQRVFVSHHVPCNICRYCLRGMHTVCETLQLTNYDPGGFAEYIRVPKINVDLGVFPLPEEISYEEGTFIEPLACVIRGQRSAGLSPADTLLVLGCGISGLLHICLAKASGAGRIVATDIHPSRLDAARDHGADMVLHAQQDLSATLKGFNKGRLADLVVVCTGASSAFRQAIECVDRSGTILFFAPPRPGEDIPLPLNQLWRLGIRLMTSYGASPLDISIAIELLRSRRIQVNGMITHRLGLAETGRGFQLVATGGECLKVIIEPQR